MNKPLYSFRKTADFLKQISAFFSLACILVFYSTTGEATSSKYSIRYVTAPLLITEKQSGEDKNYQTLNHGIEGQYLFFRDPQNTFSLGVTLLVDLGYAAANQASLNSGYRHYFLGSGIPEKLKNDQVLIESKGRLASYWGVDFRYIKYTIPRNQFSELTNVLEKDVSVNSFAGGGNIGLEYSLSQRSALNAELGINIAQFGQETSDEISIVTPFYLSFGITESF
jgi:hypothetical protein